MHWSAKCHSAGCLCAECCGTRKLSLLFCPLFNADFLSFSPLWLLKLLAGIHKTLKRSFFDFLQTFANRTKPGPSLQVEKWLCLCYLLMFQLSKTAQLKVENSAQTTFRLSPVRCRAPRLLIRTSNVAL